MRRRDTRCRSRLCHRAHGAALLEVLVALTILATVGATIVAFAAETGRALVRARETEREVRAASALLDAVALWPRTDLDRHLGDRAQGPWRMRVDRPAPTVYTIAITDSTPAREILHTTLYRPAVYDSLTRETDHARR